MVKKGKKLRRNISLYFFGDQNFKLFKLALLKGKRVILFGKIFMQMNYTCQMRTCRDKLSGSRTQVQQLRSFNSIDMFLIKHINFKMCKMNRGAAAHTTISNAAQHC